jgi:hypothetical protein
MRAAVEFAEEAAKDRRHVGKKKTMIEDGWAYGVAMSVRSLLQLLQKKGVVLPTEQFSMLEAISEEISAMQKHGAMSPNAAAEASRVVGLIYAPPNEDRTSGSDNDLWPEADA